MVPGDPPRPSGECRGGFHRYADPQGLSAACCGRIVSGMRRVWISVLLCGLLAPAAVALGPHEVLVLANANSVESVEIARAFMRMRSVPEPNLVMLALPEGTGRRISRDDFTKHIWKPAVQAATDRTLGDHILAWVYSTDFPVAVQTDPTMSIQGLTFLRNETIEAKQVEDGRYRSPLYAGPVAKKGVANLAQSFDIYLEWLGGDMPLPSMMLGVTGERGLDADAVLACLRRGVASDGTAPSGTVYYVTSGDVRSTCRDWQYRAASLELALRGVAGVVTNGLPRGQAVMGMQVGAADVDVEGLQNRFLPGAMAEHLTSLSAVFDLPSQTKLTAWLAAGATASAGAVTEPRSIWTKFPSARFFVHYAAGCTMMESFYQAVGSPVQILLVGEPLAQPWKPAGRVVISGMPTNGVSGGTVELEARIEGLRPGHYGRFLWLVDGRTAADKDVGDATSPRHFVFDADALGPGSHTVRVVAYRTGLVRSQVFDEATLWVGHASPEERME